MENRKTKVRMCQIVIIMASAIFVYTFSLGIYLRLGQASYSLANLKIHRKIITFILTLLPKVVPRFTTFDLFNCSPIKMYNTDIMAMGIKNTKKVDNVNRCFSSPSYGARFTVQVSCLVMPTMKTCNRENDHKL